MMEAEGGGTVEEATHSNEKELGDQGLNQPEEINNVEMKEENLPQDDPKAAAPNDSGFNTEEIAEIFQEDSTSITKDTNMDEMNESVEQFAKEYASS